jgi:hypothetical protein
LLFLLLGLFQASIAYQHEPRVSFRTSALACLISVVMSSTLNEQDATRHMFPCKGTNSFIDRQ